MSCRLCIKHNKQNALTGLNNNFKTTALNRHADSVDSKESVEADQLRGQLQKSVDKVMSDQESAVVVALKTAYFLAQEGMPISKHGNILDFLSELNCPHVEHLKCTKTVTYESDKAGAEMISSIASVIRKKVGSMMINSPYISFLLDESTDIATHKKLVVYARVIDMDTFTPSTHFVTNMKVEIATGVAIYNELKYVMNKQSRVIPPSKVLGLGTDGAKVMTGIGKGLAGYMLRDNPMLLNYHCIAHRLALVTSQAANAVPYLVDYQNTLRPKKIGVFTVCRPTLFYSCQPYHFFSENKKKNETCPVLLEGSQILVLVFKFFADSVVKPFTDTFGFCQSKMATFLSLFVSKNVITKIRKACLKQQVITR